MATERCRLLFATREVLVFTVNIEIFALYIFSRNTRLLKVRENMCDVKITFTIPFEGNTMINTNLNPCEIVNFLQYAKIYRSENVYVHSITGINLTCAA